MILKRAGREYYSLELTTTPAVSGWDASFDAGTTWQTGIPATVDGAACQQWLLAGPDAALGTAVKQLTDSVTPLLRATSSPEIIIRDAPKIAVL
jgi:hypothetical protein